MHMEDILNLAMLLAIFTGNSALALNFTLMQCKYPVHVTIHVKHYFLITHLHLNGLIFPLLRAFIPLSVSYSFALFFKSSLYQVFCTAG